MAGSFTIGASSVPFLDRVQGSGQEAGDVEALTLSVLVATPANWTTLLSLVTTKYGIHVPLGGSAVIDIVNGPGSGTLVCGLGTATAILTNLSRQQYLKGIRSLATAKFLIVSAWT